MREAFYGRVQPQLRPRIHARILLSTIILWFFSKCEFSVVMALFIQTSTTTRTSCSGRSRRTSPKFNHCRTAKPIQSSVQSRRRFDSTSHSMVFSFPWDNSAENSNQVDGSNIRLDPEGDPPTLSSSSSSQSWLSWLTTRRESEANSPSATDNSNNDNYSTSSSNSSGVASVVRSLDSFKRFQRVGKQTRALQQELSTMAIEGKSEDGKVKVVMDGQQRPMSTMIDETFFASVVDAAEVALAVTEAMKDAHAKSMEKMDEKMKKFYTDMGLPPPSSL